MPISHHAHQTSFQIGQIYQIRHHDLSCAFQPSDLFLCDFKLFGLFTHTQTPAPSSSGQGVGSFEKFSGGGGGLVVACLIIVSSLAQICQGLG